MSGWVKIHRALKDWEWFTDANTLQVFIYLLIMAQHEKKSYRGIDLEPGQLITGRHKIARDTGLSEQSVRTSINRLKSTNELTIKTTNKFSVVTLESWAKYQKKDNEPTNKLTNKLTNKQPTTNQQLTTYKNVKNVKNEKNVIIDTLENLKFDMHQAKAWQESVVMWLRGLGFKNIRMEDIYAEIELFWAQVTSTGETHTSPSARKHFSFWLKSKLEKTNHNKTVWDGKGMMPVNNMRKVN